MLLFPHVCLLGDKLVFVFSSVGIILKVWHLFSTTKKNVNYFYKVFMPLMSINQNSKTNLSLYSTVLSCEKWGGVKSSQFWIPSTSMLWSLTGQRSVSLWSCWSIKHTLIPKTNWYIKRIKQNYLIRSNQISPSYK